MDINGNDKIHIKELIQLKDVNDVRYGVRIDVRSEKEGESKGWSKKRWGRAPFGRSLSTHLSHLIGMPFGVEFVHFLGILVQIGVHVLYGS